MKEVKFRKKRGRCFVIMPFSKTSDTHSEEYWTNNYESFLKPLIEESGELEATRSEPLRGDIIRQIIVDLCTSRIVVADLTDRNSNVFWELGVRQSFKHGTITIMNCEQRPPSDLGAKGTLFYYPNDHIKNERFRKQFKKAIKDCLSNPDSPDSQVLEAISGRGSLFQITHREEATRRIEALISEHEHNKDRAKRIFSKAKQSKYGRIHYLRLWLRSASVELLVTNRYLDESSSFYELASQYFTWVVAINEMLRDYPERKKHVTNWFLEKINAINTVFKKYSTSLEMAQRELAESL